MDLETREGRSLVARASRSGVRTRRVVRGGLLVVVGAGASVLLFPGVALAQTSVTLSTFPADLWVTPLAGGCMALIVVIVAAALIHRTSPLNWKTGVANTSAWDSKDSWVTNLTAVGTVLTALFTQSAVGDFLNAGVDKDGFTIMSLLFGGAAVMGPVVYGAFAAKPKSASDDTSPSGTRVGLLLAALVTLTATFGLLADLGLLVSDTVASGADKDLVYVGLVVATAVTGLYAVRCTKFLAVDTAAAPGKKSAAGSEHASSSHAKRTRSLVSESPRRSGTL